MKSVATDIYNSVIKRIIEVIVSLAIVLSCLLTSALNEGVLHVQAAEMTKNQILQGAEGLFDQLVEYSVSDSEKFAGLYTGASDEQILEDQEFYAGIYSENYEKQYFVLVTNEDPYFRINYICYSTTGTGFGAEVASDMTGDFTITFLDGVWEVDCSEETEELITSTENLRAILPAEYVNVMDTSANYGKTGYCYLYLDDTFVYDGICRIDPLCFWQNEDNSIDIRIGIANGYSESAYISNLIVTFRESTLGTILEQEVPDTVSLQPGYNKTITLHFDASQLLNNGTDDWTDGYIDVHWETS